MRYEGKRHGEQQNIDVAAEEEGLDTCKGGGLDRIDVVLGRLKDVEEGRE